MALERTPNDLHRSADDPYRANLGDEELRRAKRLDNELQMDPELAEGPASSGKIAMYALAIALVLGGLFYGLNSTSVNNAGTGTSSTAQNSPSSPPAAPPGMRDLTPRANTDQGVTTGAAPAQPKAPAPAPASPTPPTK